MTRALTSPQRSKARRAVAGLLWLMAGIMPLSARPDAPSFPLTEYSAKAALLFQIAKYVDWPPEMFPRVDSPIIIGVLGDDPFGDVLDQVVRGRFINGRSIAVRRANGIGALRGAHLVFVSPSEPQAAQDCAVLEGFHVLTVGDTGQTALFTALNFSVEGDRIIFTVDLTRAMRAGITLSSRLLGVAKAVKR
jgi:hypothetical protein